MLTTKRKPATVGEILTEEFMEPIGLTQGALAWYATELVGRAAEKYLVAGKSWGDKGPKRVVTEIVESLDRDSILREARDEILARLRRGAARA